MFTFCELSQEPLHVHISEGRLPIPWFTPQAPARARPEQAEARDLELIAGLAWAIAKASRLYMDKKSESRAETYSQEPDMGHR